MTEEKTRPRRAISPSAVTGVLGAAMIGVFVFLAWYLVDPAPPKTITIATGPEGGFYQRLGQRYLWALSRYDFDVTLVPTTGTPENLKLLRDGSVDVAFVQGGVGATPPEDTPLRALATLAIEPLWLFSTIDTQLSELLDDEHIRFAAGMPGSGTRDLVERLVIFIGVSDRAELLDLKGEAAANALRDGTVDIAAFVTSPTTPWVDRLLRDRSINLVETRSLAAITRRLPFVKEIELPARIIDYAGNVPPVNKTLFGVSTGLIVQEDLHPAIKQVLLQVSTQAARGNRLLGTYGQFPNTQYTEYPIDAEADRYFTYGPTLLRRYLPFWAANLFERFWVLAIPIATLLIPIIRFGPSTVEWGIRRRIIRHYRELREIEAAGSSGGPGVRQLALDDLNRMEKELKTITVPLGYRDELYRLRMQVSFIREQLRFIDGPETGFPDASGQHRPTEPTPQG